jgi:hypothetical protein
MVILVDTCLSVVCAKLAPLLVRGYPQLLQAVAHMECCRCDAATTSAVGHNLLNLLFIRKNVGFFSDVS